MSLLMEEELESPRAPLPKTPVLITAATKWEAEPLAQILKLANSGEARWEGTLAGRKITLIKTGIGAKNAADALGRGFDPKDFGLAISAGLCGAMQREAKTGDIVADAREVDLDLVKPLRETALKLAMPFHFGKILHTNIVLRPAAKKSLGEEQRAVACDMETASLKRWADNKTAAIAVRVVLDEIHETIPDGAPEGEDAKTLALYALSNATKLPKLIQTGWRTSRSMKALSIFLKTYLETI